MTTNHTLKTDVRSLLKYGRENARTGMELAKILGFKKDRLVRLVIRELIADRVPVAALVTPPFGYFIATSLEEAEDYMKGMKKRLVNDAYRLRDFKLASRVVLNPYQMELFYANTDKK